MRIYRDPAELINEPDGLIRTLLGQRFAELSEDGTFDADALGFFAVVEPGDTMDDVERGIGCRLLISRFNSVQWGNTDFSQSWECLDYHEGPDGTPGLFEMVVVISDNGEGRIIVIPLRPEIDSTLLALCQAYAAPSPVPPGN